MNISMPPELENFVHSQIALGVYGSESELMSEALRLLYDQEDARRRKIKRLNADIQIGLDQIENGEVISAEESQKRIKKLFKEIETKNA
jgi:antitoxin ParD1/3/4